MLGRVITSKPDSNYAFIKSMDDSNTYFCHFSAVDDGFLDVGYLVEFNVGYDWKHKKSKAKDVKVVDSWYRMEK